MNTTHYWSDLADLTHETQVTEFGWCGCEDGERVYDDCPGQTYRVTYSITFTVHARNEDEARELAWQDFDGADLTASDFAASIEA